MRHAERRDPRRPRHRRDRRALRPLRDGDAPPHARHQQLRRRRPSRSARAATTILPGDESAADSRFVVRYWRKTADGRLVFGGGESNAGHIPADIAAFVRPHLLEIYPGARRRADRAWLGRRRLGDRRRAFPSCARSRRRSGRPAAIPGRAWRSRRFSASSWRRRRSAARERHRGLRRPADPAASARAMAAPALVTPRALARPDGRPPLKSRGVYPIFSTDCEEMSAMAADAKRFLSAHASVECQSRRNLASGGVQRWEPCRDAMLLAVVAALPFGQAFAAPLAAPKSDRSSSSAAISPTPMRRPRDALTARCWRRSGRSRSTTPTALVRRADGVRGRLHARAHAVGRRRTALRSLATALNDYRNVIPLSDFDRYDVVFAMQSRWRAHADPRQGPALHRLSVRQPTPPCGPNNITAALSGS